MSRFSPCFQGFCGSECRLPRRRSSLSGMLPPTQNPGLPSGSETFLSPPPVLPIADSLVLENHHHQPVLLIHSLCKPGKICGASGVHRKIIQIVSDLFGAISRTSAGSKTWLCSSSITTSSTRSGRKLCAFKIARNTGRKFLRNSLE